MGKLITLKKSIQSLQTPTAQRTFDIHKEKEGEAVDMIFGVGNERIVIGAAKVVIRFAGSYTINSVPGGATRE